MRGDQGRGRLFRGGSLPRVPALHARVREAERKEIANRSRLWTRVLVVFCMLRKKEEKKKRYLDERYPSSRRALAIPAIYFGSPHGDRCRPSRFARIRAFIVRALIGIRCRITTVWRHSVEKCRFSRAKKRPFLLLFPQDICPFDAVLVNDLAFEPRVDRGRLSKAAVTRAMSARQLTSRRATFGELTILAPLARRICAMVRKINALSLH